MSLDFLCGVDHRPPLSAEERAQLVAQQPALADLPDSPHGEWLLRAAREVAVDEMIERHNTMEAIVTRHGGLYDGGESGLFDPRRASRSDRPIRPGADNASLSAAAACSWPWCSWSSAGCQRSCSGGSR